jgi:tetratricopeptide (TPR) repeat protein
MTGYTAREVAEILGLSAGQVRSYARSGLLHPGRGPRNEYRFTFQDIVVLRAASDLLRARVHPRRVKGALTKLRIQLPRGRSLATVRVHADGEKVLVRDRDTVWEPASGQVLIDFAVSDLASRAAVFARRVVEERAATEDLQADEWYNLAHDLEAVSPEEAKEAYGRAVRLAPAHAEAHLNLGRLLHEEGHLAEAEAHYREAIAAAPTSAIAWFNLGVVLEDQGKAKDAVESYEEAIRHDPQMAAAHYNLSMLYEGQGTTTAAIRHLSEYRRLRDGAA